MKPTEYETLISQLIDNEVDMDELRSLVTAEKNKRKKEAEDAAAKERRKKIVQAARANLIDALLAYVEEVADDDAVIDYLEDDSTWHEIENALIQMEESLVQTKKMVVKTDKWKMDEDAIKKWLENKRK